VTPSLTHTHTLSHSLAAAHTHSYSNQGALQQLLQAVPGIVSVRLEHTAWQPDPNSPYAPVTVHSCSPPRLLCSSTHSAAPSRDRPSILARLTISLIETGPRALRSTLEEEGLTVEIYRCVCVSPSLSMCVCVIRSFVQSTSLCDPTHSSIHQSIQAWQPRWTGGSSS